MVKLRNYIADLLKRWQEKYILPIGLFISFHFNWLKVGTSGEPWWLLTKASVDLFTLAYKMKLRNACEEWCRVGEVSLTQPAYLRKYSLHPFLGWLSVIQCKHNCWNPHMDLTTERRQGKRVKKVTFITLGKDNSVNSRKISAPYMIFHNSKKLTSFTCISKCSELQ
jgi:hypothetical protein